uniref:ATP synthase complex subunit 8 n=1 Tax=Coomaniella copipes TaxID=2936727 RepID=A0A8T9VVG6_9COLE|nr:ATP synthase F0 subunit 8 [Coomaniella copipes]UPI13474.1 ATP synthase F0 subunit 8 [Coomaniella copipes]
MPQMAPLYWLILMILFSIIFVLFFILNYYSSLDLPQKSESIKLTNKINWKW